MKVNLREFEEYLKQFTFAEHGDRFEQFYGHHLSDNFPNCERFWRLFVVPMTKRVESYPSAVLRTIELRESISPFIEDIANANYSMYINLVFAHVHLETRMLSSLEDIYVHLGTTCDLAEAVLERWYFLLLQCRGGKPHLLDGLNRDDFLNKAREWYDNHYPEVYKHYLSLDFAL